MASYISKKFRFNNAVHFRNAFGDHNNSTVGYIFYGKHLPYDNESIPDTLTDTIITEKQLWDNMIGGKKINENDLEYVIPINSWVSGVGYKEYNDNIDIGELVSFDNTLPMYIINNENNVYKCLANNNSISTIEPTGTYLENNGNILTADNYLWKYLYKVPVDSRFATIDYIPVPHNIDQTDYNINTNIVEGEITNIKIIDNGIGYYNTDNVRVNAFSSGILELTVHTDVDLYNDIKVNMGISGIGIQNGSYITGINEISRKITLNYPTINSGGGNNLLTVYTRMVVEGDGIGVAGIPIIDNNGISGIEMTNYGIGYNYGNIIFYGTGSGASGRVILPPKFGHGYNSAKELGAYNILVDIVIGEIDATEGGILSTDTNFRQYGILINPLLYTSNNTLSYANASSIISQVTELTLVAGDDYNKDEYVYQGTIDNPTFYGYINTYESDNVKLTNVFGTISLGTVLKGIDTNETGRTVSDITYPYFSRYSGDIITGSNIIAVDRAIDQSENIKFVIKF